MSVGHIINPDRARQLIEFNSMAMIKNGKKIYPTDIDGIFDIGGEVWIIYEVKYDNKELTDGQRLLMENFVRAMKAGGKHALAIECEHHVDDPSQNVDLGQCVVRRLLFSSRLKPDGQANWMVPKATGDSRTVKSVTDAFIEYIKDGYDSIGLPFNLHSA